MVVSKKMVVLMERKTPRISRNGFSMLPPKRMDGCKDLRGEYFRESRWVGERSLLQILGRKDGQGTRERILM